MSYYQHLTHSVQSKYYTLMLKPMVMAEEMDWWVWLTTALIVRFKWHTLHSCGWNAAGCVFMMITFTWFIDSSVTADAKTAADVISESEWIL